MAMKIAFCLVVLIGLVYADLTSRPTKKASFLARPRGARRGLGAAYGAEYGRETSNVIETNLSQNDSDLIASIVQDVFDTVSNAQDQADAIQRKLDRIWEMKNNVIIDYSGVSIHEKYYAILAVNGHTVLVFGL